MRLLLELLLPPCGSQRSVVLGPRQVVTWTCARRKWHLGDHVSASGGVVWNRHTYGVDQ